MIQEHGHRTYIFGILGLTYDQVRSVPAISEEVDKILLKLKKVTGEEAPSIIDLLRSSPAPEAMRICKVYDSLPDIDPVKAIPREIEKYFELVTLEAACIKAGVPTPRCQEIILDSIVRISANQSAAIHAMSMPGIALAAGKAGRRIKTGHRDRVLVSKITGALPMPKGSQLQVNVLTGASSQVAKEALVAFEPPDGTIRRVADKFNQSPGQLPASSVAEAEFEDVEEDEPEEET